MSPRIQEFLFVLAMFAMVCGTILLHGIFVSSKKRHKKPRKPKETPWFHPGKRVKFLDTEEMGRIRLLDMTTGVAIIQIEETDQLVRIQLHTRKRPLVGFRTHN